MINFNQLRVFYHAAKTMSFTEAAKVLFITQPAVSAQVRSFEEYCDIKLFKKSGRKVYLTNEGKTLLEYARTVFEYERDIENVIEEMRELKRGVLRIGTTKTYARYFMPFMISKFHEKHPKIKIHLDEGSSLEMVNSLLEFKDEVAIIARGGEHPEVDFTPFSQEELVFIMAPDHPLSRKRSIAPEDLAEEPIIMKEIGSGTRKIINDYFSRHGLTPTILMETSNAEFIKQLVQRGEGVSFLVKEAVATELREGKLTTLPLEGGKIFLDVSIAYLKGQTPSPPAQAFLNILGKLSSMGRPTRGIGAILADIPVRKRLNYPG
jgi:DNA-binding transcriptional LysR family regulator